MKKLFLLFTIFTLHFTLHTSHYLYGSWPINRTPAIEGKVVDVTTGEGIENVVISATWYKLAYWKPSFGGTPSEAFSKEIIITNKEGKYKIPSKTSLHILTGFDDVRISVIHPLYETKEFGLVNKSYDEIDPKKIEMVKKYGYMLWGYGIDIGSFTYTDKNTIIYDIKLLSLEEKYVKAIENVKLEMTNEEERKKKLDDLGYEFGKNIRKHMDGIGGIVNFKYNNKYLFNIEEVFNEWNKLVEKAVSIFDEIGMKERAENLRSLYERTKKWILDRRETNEK